MRSFTVLCVLVLLGFSPTHQLDAINDDDDDDDNANNARVLARAKEGVMEMLRGKKMEGVKIRAPSRGLLEIGEACRKFNPIVYVDMPESSPCGNKSDKSVSVSYCPQKDEDFEYYAPLTMPVSSHICAVDASNTRDAVCKQLVEGECRTVLNDLPWDKFVIEVRWTCDCYEARYLNERCLGRASITPKTFTMPGNETDCAVEAMPSINPDGTARKDYSMLYLIVLVAVTVLSSIIISIIAFVWWHIKNKQDRSQSHETLVNTDIPQHSFPSVGRTTTDICSEVITIQDENYEASSTLLSSSSSVTISETTQYDEGPAEATDSDPLCPNPEPTYVLKSPAASPDPVNKDVHLRPPFTTRLHTLTLRERSAMGIDPPFSGVYGADYIPTLLSNSRDRPVLPLPSLREKSVKDEKEEDDEKDEEGD